MKASLSSLNAGLADLRHYIRGLEYQSSLLSVDIRREECGKLSEIFSNFHNHISQSPGSKKRFEYNTIIISLYGYLEQFIESLITAYVNNLNEIIPDYENLPEPMKKHHLDLSFGLINRRELQQYRGKISHEQLISNLNSCYSKKEKFIINADAFAQHTANFRLDLIDSLFARVGIQKISELIRTCSSFKNFLSNRYSDRQIEGIRPDVAFYHLNDIAERRNEIAHGVTSDEILSKDLLLEYVEFFEIYGAALSEVIHRSALPYLAKHKGVAVGNPLVVYNNSIVCFSLKNIVVAVGDILIAQPANSSHLYLGGQILEIQADRINHEKINIQESLDVAMKVDFKAKHNQTFFHVPKSGH